MSFEGQVAVVIGSTSGIGRALALGLAEAGADVVACSRSDSATAVMAAEIRSIGRRTCEVSVDVTSRASIENLCSAVLAEFGSVHILVNCAGMTKRVPTLECTEELWEEIMNVNLNGTLRACQVFGKHMLARGYGKVINIASLATFVAFHEVAPYCASKAAVGALTRSLAVEWAPSGVSVNAIAPGVFPTALNSALLHSPRGAELTMRTPMGRYGAAEELVTALLYLADPRTTFTTGQIIAVDGGFLASGVNQ